MAMTLAQALVQTQAQLDRSKVLLDTIKSLQEQVGILTEQLAASQALEQEDQATIADLQGQLVAAEQTIADLTQQLADCEAGHDPPKGALFGAFAGPLKFPNTGPVETKADMRARVDTALGPLAVERIFNEGSWTVPAAGIPAILSITQDPVAVARGDFDAQITALAAANWSGWLVLNHECDQSTRPYTPAQQVEGFKHFSSVCRSAGNPRVKVAMILMSWTLSQGADRWRDWYPGPEYVDALGWDAYWRPTIPHTAEDIYGPAYGVTQAEGKDFLICETSIGAQGAGGWLDKGRTQPVPEDVRTGFVTDAIAYLTDKAAAVTWFETNKVDGNWLLEGHPEALGLWSAAVQSSLAAKQ